MPPLVPFWLHFAGGEACIGPLFALGSLATVCHTATDEAGRVISSTCPSGAAQTGIDVGAVLLLVFYVVGPILSAVHLAVRLRRNGGATGVVIAPPVVITTGAM
jgi:hypothetical protein